MQRPTPETPTLPVSAPAISAVAERRVYWTDFLVNGRQALYFITSRNEWYGWYYQLDGEKGEDAEARIWRLLNLTDPLSGQRRPDLRII